MKTPISLFLVAVASAASLSGATTITVVNNVPNGSASGGSGSGSGALTTSLGTILTNRGMPVTTYTISNVDLTSVGGSANESFTFTVSYTATTDGSTPGSSQFNGFGNVSVTGGADSNQVDGTETLTATITLTGTTFANLTLVGFTKARAGGFTSGESGTFTYASGSDTVAFGNTIADVSGNYFTLTVASGTRINVEGFEAQFVAIPEPASASLLALGAVALLRRRRTA